MSNSEHFNLELEDKVQKEYNKDGGLWFDLSELREISMLPDKEIIEILKDIPQRKGVGWKFFLNPSIIKKLKIKDHFLNFSREGLTLMDISRISCLSYSSINNYARKERSKLESMAHENKGKCFYQINETTKKIFEFDMNLLKRLTFLLEESKSPYSPELSNGINEPQNVGLTSIITEQQNKQKEYSLIELCLHKEFGYQEFRPLQKEIINSIMEGKDTFAILPTGSGKSLTYQLPARLLRPKLTVIISPLISLMEDQITKTKNIKAVALHSDQSRDKFNEAYSDVKNGNADILYVSPEKLSSNTLMDLLKSRDIGLFAIDEAHCISIWGHNFRPSYLFLPDIRKKLGNPQIALFTATAPPHAREDIIKVMKLGEHNLIQGDVIRGNINFNVQYETLDNRKDALMKILSERHSLPGSIIIYGTTIEEVEGLHDLVSREYKTAIYHGQMKSEIKKVSQERFMSNDAKIMVCTSAFGMGIDKPDVYTIIHNSLPGSLEQYIQEAGRAGRDGNVAEATLLYNDKDLHIRNFFILNANPSPEAIHKAYQQVFKTSKKISEYQRRPISYTQLKWFFDDVEKEKWFRNRASSALSTLVNLGFIVREGDEITFPHGPDIDLPHDLLEAKLENDFRRLQIMELYAKSEGNHSIVIKNYFLGATKSLVEATENIALTINDKILGFVGNCKEPKGRIETILTGEEGSEEEYKGFHRSLPFVSRDFVGQKLIDLTFSGLVSEAKVGGSLRYLLTEVGAQYLEKRGVPIKPRPSIEEDIHDYRNRNDIKKELKRWADENSIDTNILSVWWKRGYNSFINNDFYINNKKHTGADLLNYHSGHEANDAAFRQFMEYFLGIEFETKISRKYKPDFLKRH